MKSIYKIIILLIILFSGIAPVFADDTEWVDPRENTLRMTESFTRGGYQIEATDFFEDMALITVYDSNHNIIIRNITRKDDYFVVNDINITAIDLHVVSGNISAGHGLNVTVDQWVRIQTRVVGKPSIRISIIPKGIEIKNRIIVRRTYIPGSEIPINFSIRNEGKSKLKDMILKINTSLPVLYDEKLNYEIMELGGGNESDAITVRFQAPYTEERRMISISAEAKGYDIFGNAYRGMDSAYIEIAPPYDNNIEVGKFIPEKVYMGDSPVVSLIIRNNGSQKFDNVNLTDSVPRGMEPLDTNLSWNFALGPFEQKVISYSIRPQKPGTYFFLPGSSIIEYQGTFGYNKKPNKLIVNGPYVVLTKSASNYDTLKGEKINVTVEAKNLGDATAIIKIIDTLPMNHTLNPENQTYELISDTMVLHPGISESFSYSLLTSGTGSFILPPANATILDKIMYKDERYTQRATSAELIIKVREPLNVELSSVKRTSIPKKTGSPESIANISSTTPKSAAGFQGYIFIILFIVICVIKKLNFRN